MNLIGFSHHYTKMHGQTHGTLVYVDDFIVRHEDFDSEWMKYDTEYKGSDGIIRHYDFPKLDEFYVRMVFLGNKNIPFTTYRAIRDYRNLIGTDFIFKFKGEPIPESYIRLFNQFEVKIYE